MIKRKRNLQSLFKRIPITPIGLVPPVRISGTVSYTHLTLPTNREV